MNPHKSKRQLSYRLILALLVAASFSGVLFYFAENHSINRHNSQNELIKGIFENLSKMEGTYMQDDGSYRLETLEAEIIEIQEAIGLKEPEPAPLE